MKSTKGSKINDRFIGNRTVSMPNTNQRHVVVSNLNNDDEQDDLEGKRSGVFSFFEQQQQLEIQRTKLNNKTNINYGTITTQNGPPNKKPSKEDNKFTQTAVSDVVGGFGLFQFLVLLFSGLRECLVGYDALIMSVIFQPEEEFVCRDNLRPDQLLDLHPSRENLTNMMKMSRLNETLQCFRSLDGVTPLKDQLTGQPVRCESWLFADETLDNGPSLVAEWELVCHNHWLVAFIESAYFFGLVTGNLCWGYCADKFGRRPAYLMAHTIALIFGSLAVITPSSIWIFALCRYLAAFGSIGYNIIYSIQVEIIGAKHRSFCTILNHAGWGLGVIFVPIVDHLFDDYRPIIAVAPIFTLLMFPWAFWLPESCRWLMANDRFDEARQELLRAAKFNGKLVTPSLEKQIFNLEQKIRHDKLSQRRASRIYLANGEIEEPPVKRSYKLIFCTPALLRDTLILSYVTFSGHLFYYLLTINFAYVKNLSTTANFVISGAGEWALIDTDMLPSLDTPTIITSNNAVGTLSALLLIFIVLIVNQEVYPTVVRQTGTSITNTLGESGSTLAPLIIQFSRLIGSTWANVLYTFICLFGIIAVQFVTKTDDIELQDT